MVFFVFGEKFAKKVVKKGEQEKFSLLLLMKKIPQQFCTVHTGCRFSKQKGSLFVWIRHNMTSTDFFPFSTHIMLFEKRERFEAAFHGERGMCYTS